MRRPHLADLTFEPSPLNDPPTTGKLDRHRDKVCIYAAGMGRDEAPLDDDTWDVWALNLVPPLDSAGRLRADLWFDLHQRHAQTADDMRWIAKCPVPIVVPDDLLDASDNAIALPLDDILDAFPGAPFACTFAYQMALAFLMGYPVIGLYGVELAYGDARERTVEWACVNWWIGYLEAQHVHVRRPHETRLGRHPYLYGFEYDDEKENTARYVWFTRDTEEGSSDGA